jgi:hypothetical protein
MVNHWKTRQKQQRAPFPITKPENAIENAAKFVLPFVDIFAIKNKRLSSH